MHHPYFGEIKLDDGWLELEKQLGETTLAITAESTQGQFDSHDLDVLARACHEYTRLETLARARIRDEYQDLFPDAFSIWAEDDPSLLERLKPGTTNVAELGADDYDANIALKEIRLHAGEPDDLSIVLDFSFKVPQPNDYLVGAYFDESLQLSHVAVES